MLRRAKLECDYLIVGVTTDELVLSRKNKTPIIPLRERMEILNHIDFVDDVVPQANMNKLEAWKDLKFNKMFVGDDWKNSKTWNKLENDFSAVGVEIVYFPYTNHTSSTKLREALEKLK